MSWGQWLEDHDTSPSTDRWACLLIASAYLLLPLGLFALGWLIAGIRYP